MELGKDDLEVFEYFFIFILGAVFGSFLNVVILRVPENLSIVFPNSTCPKCGHKIRWYENIPILSFFILRGKCSSCKESISLQYPIVEFITALVLLVLYFKVGLNLNLVLYFIYFALLIVLSFIDFRYKAVPSSLLLLTFLFSFIATTNDIFEALKNGVLIAGAIYLLNFMITYYIQNIKSKILKDESLKEQEALGEGDIPIFATFGVILSIKAAFVAIFLSAIFAIIPSIINIIYKKEIQTPFIPYLSLGIFCEFIFELSLRF